MKKVSHWLEENMGMSPYVQKYFISLLIIFLVWLLHFLILKIIHSRIKDVKERYYWRNGVSYILVILGVLALLLVWVEAYGSLGTFLGLLSAGLAIALKDQQFRF
jgi:small-conductance mechanosensitive channel